MQAFIFAALLAAGYMPPPHVVPSVLAQQSSAAPAQGAQSASAKSIGAITSISGDTFTLTPDSGPEVKITVQNNASIVRVAPGETNLKNATPLRLQDLQVGDRVRVKGQPSNDAKEIVASSIVVMTRSDVDARKERERQDWQKRGLGGLVSAVDVAAGTVTISVAGIEGSKNIVIQVSKTTVVRRYAPDSVKFEDAKPSSLQEIQPGNQLRARGDHNADTTQLQAEEIVTGSFRNIAGTINSVDLGAGTINVQDLQSRKPVQVRVTADSQLHKLPAEMAQHFAARLKGATNAPAAGTAPAAGAPPSTPTSAQPPPSGGSPGVGAPHGGGMGAGIRSGGVPDLQQMLSRTPAVALADLHKGDAVVILATEGSSSGSSTAITLVSGVEPILQAAPSAAQSMMLAPWTLGGPSGDAANQ
jgi:hypothetical protein